MLGPIVSNIVAVRTITGSVTITGDLTVEGNFNFGDAATDILTVAGYLQGSASGKTYLSVGTGTPGNLGTPQIDDLYVKGRLEVDGVLYPDGGLAAGTTVGGHTIVTTGDKISVLAATTSAELAGVISDETGSGALVFATSPTLVSPALGTPASGDLQNCTEATTSAKGVVELATAAEVNTGTDATRPITPDTAAGSNLLGRKEVQMVVFDFTTDVATGDGAFYLHIGQTLNGMNLIDVHAEVITAGTTGTTDIQIHNLTDGQDMLSTVITIDSGETGSDTAATPAVINTSYDDVATNDVLRIDVDAVQTTAPKGLIVTLGFQLP